MRLGEVLLPYSDDRQRARADEETRALVRIADGSSAAATSQATMVVAHIKAFVEWLRDPRPAFAETLEGEDKFAQLVELSRAQQDCANYFSTEVGVNTSTVWRWSTGRSRPSKFVGKNLAVGVQSHLRMALLELARDQGLI